MTYEFTSYTLRQAENVTRACTDVICNHCGERVISKIRQLDFIQDKGIIVQGLRCDKCKTTYILSVTDNQLRKNMILAQETKEKFETDKSRRDAEFKSFIRIRGFIPKDVKKRWEIKISQSIDKYNKLNKENKARGDILKGNYMRGE